MGDKLFLLSNGILQAWSLADNTNLTKLVRAAMFAALAVGLGYSLMLVPNIELITVIIFLSGLTLGIRWGILVGAVSEFIFSAMNPLGSSLMFPPLIAAQIISMIIVGLSGGLLRPVFFKKKLWDFLIFLVSQAFLTPIYLGGSKSPLNSWKFSPVLSYFPPTPRPNATLVQIFLKLLALEG